MNESYVLAEVSNENQTLVAVVQQDHQQPIFTFIPPKPTAIAIRCAPAGCATRRRAVAGRSRRAGTRAAADAGGGVLPQHEGEAPLNPEGLMVVWSESDDGAALWYYGQLLAVIPGWSLYIDHSVCYSASCIKESPLAYPLGSASTNTQYAQAESTRQFWRSWQREEGNPWPKMQRDFQARYEPHFGPSVKYYAIDQGKWPPMAITQHERDGIYYFLTMG